MNQLKTFFVAVAIDGQWGKGKTLLKALANIGRKDFRAASSIASKSRRYPEVIVTQFLLKDETPEEVVEKIYHSYSVDRYGMVRFVGEDPKEALWYLVGFTQIQNFETTFG